jgi:signal transduction histidine kinase
MKQNLIRLTRRYVMALGNYLRRASRTSLLPARGLGRQCLAFGLDTLDLARMHEQALAGHLLPGSSAGKRALMTKRSGIFFEQANVPLEETHQAAREAKIRLTDLQVTLGRRTGELAVSHRKLQSGIRSRKTMKNTFAASGKRQDQSLEESLQLQKRLRLLTRRVMVAREDERRKISRELQDEIVQTLVGINVRLLSLKQTARTNTNDLKNRIASTQELVVKSAKSVRRFARGLESLSLAPATP